jgi:hypothetical protein
VTHTCSLPLPQAKPWRDTVIKMPADVLRNLYVKRKNESAEKKWNKTHALSCTTTKDDPKPVPMLSAHCTASMQSMLDYVISYGRAAYDIDLPEKWSFDKDEHESMKLSYSLKSTQELWTKSGRDSDIVYTKKDVQGRCDPGWAQRYRKYEKRVEAWNEHAVEFRKTHPTYSGKAGKNLGKGFNEGAPFELEVSTVMITRLVLGVQLEMYY